MTPSKSKAEEQAAKTGNEDPKTEAQELREEIDETRQDLGDTVEQLAHKADVKGQAQAKADETKQRAQAQVDQVKRNPAPAGGIAAAIAGLIVLIWLLRRR